MICSNCQTENKPGYRFCANCGSQLEEEKPDEGIRGSRPKKAVVKIQTEGKNPVLLAVLSFFVPGAGHLAVGDSKKALYLFGGAVLLVLTGIGYFLVGIYAAYDVYKLIEGNAR